MGVRKEEGWFFPLFKILGNWYCGCLWIKFKTCVAFTQDLIPTDQAPLFRILLTTAIRSVQVVFCHLILLTNMTKSKSKRNVCLSYDLFKGQRSAERQRKQAQMLQTDSTRKVNENDSRDGDFGQRLLRSLLLSVHWISFIGTHLPPGIPHFLWKLSKNTITVFCIW